jgi:hypothetical protein
LSNKRPKIIVDKHSSKSSKRKKQQQEGVPEGSKKRPSATRSSSRLAKEGREVLEEVPVEEPDNKENEDNFTVNYDTMPTKAEELDDCEFIVYAKLRTWRLLKSLELDIEPYKIAQNRTFAELVRRRRNDQHWATNIDDSSLFAEEVMACWGIGPAKAQEGGFADDFIHILEDQECLDQLAKSRRISATDLPQL